VAERESLKEWGYFYSSLKKLAIGLFFKFWTLSGVVGQSPVGVNNVHVTLSGEDSWFLWEYTRIGIFHFILHTPLDSTMFLHSKNLKASCSIV
jgi:hypothetical protein